MAKAFGPKIAVAEINVDVPRGSFFGIVGPNGAGKTTTLRMATGLLRPDRGQVWVDGIDVWADPIAAKARIGVLPEDLALFERLRGRELPRVPRPAAQHADRRDRRAAPRELLDLLGLSDAADTLVVDYSHGMRKKLVLAAAMLHGPRLLFLDEPFEAIDPGVGPRDPVGARALHGRRRHDRVLQSRDGARRADVRSRRGDGRAAASRGPGPLDAAARGRHARRRVRRARRRAGRAARAVVVGTFVRLKLRLLRNGLHIGQGAVLFAIGAIGAGVLGLSGFAALAAARGDTIAPDLAIVVFGIATLGWTVLPILGFGNDETLDPQRLATLPLSRRQLVTGVLAASLRRRRAARDA